MNEIVSLVEKINRAVRDERNQRVAASTVLAQYKPRIFEQGKDGNNAKIGTYSTNPISISKKNQARNTGKTKFEGGYAEYKSAIGKNPGHVNLRNTDQMMMDLGIVKNGQDWAFGFQNDLNGQKATWMTDKYDKPIFHATQQEIDLFISVLQDLVNRST